jgi:uncharacterized membrane protein YfcA
MDFSVITLSGMMIAAAAGFFQGLTGFGFALLAMPVLARLIPVKQAVPVIVLLSLAANVVVFISCRKSASFKAIWRLAVSALIAVPPGTFVLVYVAPEYIKLAAGIVVTAAALLMLAGKTFPVRNEKTACFPVGFVSGFLNGSISMSGPPVALFLSNQNSDRNSFRANMVLYGIFLNIVTVGSFTAGNLLTKPVLTAAVLLLPCMAAGTGIGILAAGKLNNIIFKKIALTLIIVSGSSTAVSALLTVLQ